MTIAAAPIFRPSLPGWNSCRRALLTALPCGLFDLKTDTGDRRARQAASIYGAPENAGRKEIEDCELLDKVAGLIAAGKGRSAATIVARSASTDPKQQYAIAQSFAEK